MLKTITVFCGSANSCPDKYKELAEEVGRVIARQNRRLVYGAGSRGLMGIVAKAAQAENGYVIGVNCKRFEGSKYKLDVDEYYITDTMQERKVKLLELGDASITIPGGIGTLDELTEIFSLVQLGIMDKPFGILNFDGYFDGLLAQIERAHQDKFIRDKDMAHLIVADDVETLLALLDNHYEQRALA